MPRRQTSLAKAASQGRVRPYPKAGIPRAKAAPLVGPPAAAPAAGPPADLSDSRFARLLLLLRHIETLLGVLQTP